jgi:hypothetical protein
MALMKQCTPQNASTLFADWGPHIDVVGFCFLDLASNFKPEQALVDFLKAGPPPVYIGFGSLVSGSELRSGLAAK